MPFINCPNALAALTADGDADGHATVADASAFYPGAKVWLRSATVEPKEYVITEVLASNKIGLRETSERSGSAGYGRSPLAQWKLADGAKLFQDAQVVPVELSNVAKLNR